MKVRYVFFAVLAIAGLAIGFFVPFTTIAKTAMDISAPVIKMLTPQEKKSLLQDAKPPVLTAPRVGVEAPGIGIPEAPKAGEPAALAVSTNVLDSILNFLQRILGFASTLVGLFLGVRTLKGSRKERERPPKQQLRLQVTRKLLGDQILRG